MQGIELNPQINSIAGAIHSCAAQKGWWDRGRNFAELVALMHSELSEALEAWREDKPPLYFSDGKPEGWGIELIDCVIRILDALAQADLDVESMLRAKMQYNEGRPYRHGGKQG